MRIAQVVTTQQFAGTERYALDVSAGLVRRGHQVVVVGGDPRAMRRQLPPGVLWAPGGTPGQAARELARFRRLHVVHSHTTKSDFVAAGTSVLTRAVRVSTRHITAARGWSRTARLVARHVRRTLDVEIAVSAFTASALPEGRPDEVLLNGVPSVADEVDGRQVQRADVVVLAQRLAPDKGTDVALRAFAASGLGSRGWTLHVAGDGSERPGLQALVHELGLDGQVRFLGWVDDVDTLYRQASIMLAPAPAEPLGLSVLEAAARGLPVVVSAAAGHLETIGTAPHARTFPVGDHRAAARQLCELADDPEGRRRYGQELQELQRSTFSLEHHVEELENIYVRALVARGAS